MINILYTISAFRNTGPNKLLENIVKCINKNKYNVFVLSYLDDDDAIAINKLRKMNVIVISLKLKRKLDIIYNGVKELNDIILENNIQIVHSHGILPDISNAKSISPIKITTIHDNMFEDYIYTFGKLRGYFFVKWHIYYLKKFQKCVCCSFTSYEALRKHINNSTFIRNSIFSYDCIPFKTYEKKRKEIREKYKINLSDVVYLYAGKLSKLKRIEDLVCFFNDNLIENQYLFILGNGELENKIKSIIKNKNIIFCGFCDNVVDYMIASDIYCSFSSSEGFSISVLEALQTYNLLFVSDIPSHKEVFEVDNKLYLGEYFNYSNILDKFLSLKNKVGCIDYNKYNTFLQDNLSIVKMVDKYDKIYIENLSKDNRGCCS